MVPLLLLTERAKPGGWRGLNGQWEVAPWPEPVAGPALLDDLAEVFRRYIPQSEVEALFVRKGETSQC